MINFAFFPILLGIWMLCAYIWCYTLGKMWHHYDSFWPMVSESGNYIPEAAVFTLVFVYVGNLVVIVVTLRFLQVGAIIDHKVFIRLITKYYNRNDLNEEEITLCKNHWKNLNKGQLFLGLVSGYMIMGVGALRLSDSFLWHYIFAVGLFGTPAFYMIIDGLYFTQIFKGPVNTAGISCWRLTILAIGLPAEMIFLFLTAWILLSPTMRPIHLNPAKRLFWASGGHPGVGVHLASTITEWIYLCSVPLYLSTFSGDLSRLYLGQLQFSYTFLDGGGEGNAEENASRQTSRSSLNVSSTSVGNSPKES